MTYVINVINLMTYVMSHACQNRPKQSYTISRRIARLRSGPVRKAEREGIVRLGGREVLSKIGLASSFGAEDMVIIDLLSQSGFKAKIFTLDTGRLPQETYDLMDEVRSRYDVTIDVYFPDTSSVQKMVKNHGLNLFYQNVEFRKLCCEIRKVEPLGRALEGLDAWITGLRRDQTATRASLLKVEEDGAHGGIMKINPLAEWTWTQVFDYVKEKSVPYNRLHD